MERLEFDKRLEEEDSSDSSSDSDSEYEGASARDAPPPPIDNEESSINQLTLCDDDGPSLLLQPPIYGPEDGDYGKQ